MDEKKKGDEKDKDGFEKTDIFLNLSRSGKALTIKSDDGSILSVAVSQVERLIKGEIKGLTFSRSYPQVQNGGGAE